MVGKKTKGRSLTAKYSVWRYYAPASVVSPEDSSAPPLSLLRTILETLGHESLSSLAQEIRKHERHSLPKRLQSKIAKLFTVYTCSSASARSLALRPLQVSFSGKRWTIPYPFSLCSPVKVVSFTIYDFTLRRDTKRRTLSMQGRFGVSTNPCLKPRNQGNAKFCQLIASGALVSSDPSDEETMTIRSWLTANGFPKATAGRAAIDETFRSDLDFQIATRHEEFLGLQGARALSLMGEPLVVDGDEESGFTEVSPSRREYR